MKGEKHMKVKIIVEADICGPVDSDMHAMIDEKITELPFVNHVEKVGIRTTVGNIQGRR